MVGGSGPGGERFYWKVVPMSNNLGGSDPVGNNPQKWGVFQEPPMIYYTG